MAVLTGEILMKTMHLRQAILNMPPFLVCGHIEQRINTWMISKLSYSGQTGMLCSVEKWRKELMNFVIKPHTIVKFATSQRKCLMCIGIFEACAEGFKNNRKLGILVRCLLFLMRFTRNKCHV